MAATSTKSSLQLLQLQWPPSSQSSPLSSQLIPKAILKHKREGRCHKPVQENMQFRRAWWSAQGVAARKSRCTLKNGSSDSGSCCHLQGRGQRYEGKPIGLKCEHLRALDQTNNFLIQSVLVSCLGKCVFIMELWRRRGKAKIHAHAHAHNQVGHGSQLMIELVWMLHAQARSICVIKSI